MLLGCFAFAKAQLGFCNGAAGDPIFMETFGAGVTNGPPLSAIQTTYRYVNGGVQDGEYTISNNLRQLGSFHNVGDHTGDTDGKALIVNASFEPDQFYQTTITGLCENTNYEFSAWIINLLDGSNNVCTGREVPVQVRFEIWDITDSNRLAQGTMNPSFATTSPTWEQYGLTFTTAAGENGCILKMINEAPGGCGNDLAIDDIIFRTCGDVATISDAINNTSFTRCSDDPNNPISLSVITGTAVFNTPVYQWQSSPNGIDFTDLVGENTPNFTTTSLTNTTFYRVKIAEDAVNLTGSECSNFSEVFEYRIVEVPLPVANVTSVTGCANEIAVLEAIANAGFVIDWYNQPTGGDPIEIDTNRLEVNLAGTYYAQAREPVSGCISRNRVSIEYNIANPPLINSEDFIKCENDVVTLDPQFDELGATYQWSSGESSPTIQVQIAGTYTCTVTNATGCSSTTTFQVSNVSTPQIIELLVVDNSLKVITNDGDFLYQYNQGGYQDSNMIDISDLLSVQVDVSDQLGCNVISRQYNRIGVPQFFTPNADGFNDQWSIENITAFPGTVIEIYDRYGKLLHVMNEDNNQWDGTLNNEPLPSSDYWYRIEYADQELKGNFTLKR